MALLSDAGIETIEDKLKGCPGAVSRLHASRRVYETAFFGSRGDRLIVKAKANDLSTKPEPVLRHFFEMFVDENTTMLDPTCGSGTALCAANYHKAARVLGLEINPEFAENAELLLAGTRGAITRPASAAL